MDFGSISIFDFQFEFSLWRVWRLCQAGLEKLKTRAWIMARVRVSASQCEKRCRPGHGSGPGPGSVSRAGWIRVRDWARPRGWGSEKVMIRDVGGSTTKNA